MFLLPLLAATAAVQAPLPAASREFSVPSADGTRITGTVDFPAREPKAVVVMVAGTGLFDRDVRFGRSNTPRDLLFKDLAVRWSWPPSDTTGGASIMARSVPRC